MIKTYLASGWFNEKQKSTMEKVYLILKSYPDLDIFAPYYNGIVLTKGNDSPEMRKKVFSSDIGTISFSDLVVAVIDDFEPGTIFEMGGAGILSWLYDTHYDDYYLKHVPRIIAYSDVTGRGLNVMLQQSVWGFANGESELREQLKRFISGDIPVDFLGFKRGDFV